MDVALGVSPGVWRAGGRVGNWSMVALMRALPGVCEHGMGHIYGHLVPSPVLDPLLISDTKILEFKIGSR